MMRNTVEEICKSHGVSRQAYYKWQSCEHHRVLEEDIILQYVRSVRYRMPRLGVRKLHYLLQDKFKGAGFTIGRDRLFDLLRDQHLLVERRKRYIKTTDSVHGFNIYQNLLKGREVRGKDQVFAADITYIELRVGFCYLSLVMDVYSRKIVGYEISSDLSTDGPIRALRMALRRVDKPEGLIHHSDRGIQYCSKRYVDILKGKGIQVSMSGKGNPYDNAIAERTIGILKSELLLNQQFVFYEHAKRAAIEAIKLYNEERPHMGIGLLTPKQKYAA